MFGETWKNEATTITKQSKKQTSQQQQQQQQKRGGGEGGQIYIFSILEIAFQVEDI